MSMKYTKIKSLIFDGTESEILNKSFDLDTKLGVTVSIKFNDFANNDFEGLCQILSDDDFELLIQAGEFVLDKGFLPIYKNSDNLRLYYYKTDNIVMVFAYGEFQPTRYKLYLEGTRLIDNY
jgi:hypothetical protein